MARGKRDIRRRFETRASLYSLIRQTHHELNAFDRPIVAFLNHPCPSPGRPKYFADLGYGEYSDINGMLMSFQSFVFPHEPTIQRANAIAVAIWSMKDHTQRVCRAFAITGDLDERLDGKPHLLVTADLANSYKHGPCNSRSGLSPVFGIADGDHNSHSAGVVRLDTANCGLCELYYDGSRKHAVLLVSRPNPIQFHVDVLVTEDETASSLGSARTVFRCAMRDWITVFEEIGLLDDDDRETIAIKKLLLPYRRRSA